MALPLPRRNKRASLGLVTTVALTVHIDLSYINRFWNLKIHCHNSLSMYVLGFFIRRYVFSNTLKISNSSVSIHIMWHAIFWQTHSCVSNQNYLQTRLKIWLDSQELQATQSKIIHMKNNDRKYQQHFIVVNVSRVLFLEEYSVC